MFHTTKTVSYPVTILSMIQVETIGDCYLAVTGLPEPRPDHALAMVRFAKAISTKMLEVTSKLEESLGPDTASLQIRIGKCLTKLLDR